MSLTMWLYWIDVLSNLTIILVALGCFCGFMGAAHLILQSDDCLLDESKRPKLLKRGATFLSVSVSLFMVVVFIPSKQTMHAMLAAEAATEIVKHPEVQKIGGRALEILNKKLDEMEGEK